jgi:hypothetical protein
MLKFSEKLSGFLPDANADHLAEEEYEEVLARKNALEINLEAQKRIIEELTENIVLVTKNEFEEQFTLCANLEMIKVEQIDEKTDENLNLENLARIILEPNNVFEFESRSGSSDAILYSLQNLLHRENLANSKLAMQLNCESSILLTELKRLRNFQSVIMEGENLYSQLVNKLKEKQSKIENLLEYFSVVITERERLKHKIFRSIDSLIITMNDIESLKSELDQRTLEICSTSEDNFESFLELTYRTKEEIESLHDVYSKAKAEYKMLLDKINESERIEP